jgi:sugar phosphate isomerase/epimerase
LSTHLFANHRLSTVWFDRIQDAGIGAVEIYCARQHFDYTNRAQIAEMAAWFRDSDMQLHSLHSPMYTDDVWGRSGPHAVITITEVVKPKRIAMVDEIKRALEVAESIPFRYMVQHIGVGEEEYDDHKVEAAFNALDELSSFARQRGVEILAQTHLKLGFCFDIGHANMNEGVEAAWNIMGSRVRSTHLHDNDGKSDKHLFPFLSEGGTVDWKKAMGLLRSHPEQYPLLLELKEVPEFGPHPFDKAEEIFERLESL